MSRQLTSEDNLFDYFHACVDDARAVDAIELTDETALYVAQLLSERARTDREAPQAHTLAELHAQAMQLRPAEQAKTWRELGDRALYDLGYFTERLEGGTVSLDYYQAMGSTAYRRVDQVFKRWFADAFGHLFEELSAHFDDCVRVVSAVRRAHEPQDDIEALYAEWMATGSEEIARQLRKRGLVIPRRGGHLLA
jgi:hypothetical protein